MIAMVAGILSKSYSFRTSFIHIKESHPGARFVARQDDWRSWRQGAAGTFAHIFLTPHSSGEPNTTTDKFQAKWNQIMAIIIAIFNLILPEDNPFIEKYPNK